MKKILFAIVLVCTISFCKAETFAASIKNKNLVTQIKTASGSFERIVGEKIEECTVTVEGKISISGSGITVTCASTADNCTTAATNAVNCVKATIKAVKAAIT